MSNNYLIIAGTNKAGTTSFFEYLADHPAVCPSYIKQTFFFLDKKWQQHWGMKAIYDYEDGLDQFQQYFRNPKPGQLYLEATPDYIYAPEVPGRIHEFLKDKKGKILFILRDPARRFISLFHFGKQQGLVQEDMTFESFQHASRSYKGTENMSLLAYQTGFYSKYLKRYYDYFDPEDILIYFFEDLKSHPTQLLQRTALDIGIDPTFYDNYEFQTFNPTVKVKSRLAEDAYNKMREVLLHSVYKNPIGYKVINGIKKKVTPIYKKLNAQEVTKEAVSEKDVLRLIDIYKQETLDLEALTGLEVPWKITI